METNNLNTTTFHLHTQRWRLLQRWIQKFWEVNNLNILTSPSIHGSICKKKKKLKNFLQVTFV